MQCMGKVSLILGTLALLLFLAGRAGAQTSSGSISGRVVDPSGAAVANAQITATDISTKAQSKATSNSAGTFQLAYLPPGTYAVSVQKSGFQTLVVQDIPVSVGVDHGLGQLKLAIGAVSQTVTVSGATPLLTTTQAQVSNVVGSNELQEFPGIQEAQGLDMIALQLPGIVNARDTALSNSNGADFAVNGIQSRFNDQQIDGQNNNDNSVGGPSLFVDNPDFVNQYEVITDNFAPQYGRNSGSVVVETTKSGADKWHGDVSGTESNSVLNSLSNIQKRFEGLTKVPRFNNEFTDATIGGPLWKNKVFVFGGFDDQIDSSKGVDASGNLTPTPAGIGEMAGCFPGSPSVAALTNYGPYAAGGSPFVLPGSATTVDLSGGSYPGFTPNDTNGTCAVQMGGVGRTLPDGFHEYDWIYRNDVTLSAKDHFFGRYMFQKITDFNVDEGQGAQGVPVNIPSLSQTILLGWTHTFNGRMMNELRYSFGRANVQFGGNTIGTLPAAQAIGTAITSVGFSSPGLLGFGPNAEFPQSRIVNTIQVQDNWSDLVGNQALTAGVNFTRQRSPNIFLPSYNGVFTFSDWSAFAQNVPGAIEIDQGNPNFPFLENDTFLYVGDNYHVTPSLTLNLGLTYDYWGQPVNFYHNLTVTRESNPATAFFNPSLPLSIRTVPSIPSVKNALGPGIGFAWNPKGSGWLLGNGKTVIRGGYRLVYDTPYYNIYSNMYEDAPLVLSQTLTGTEAASNPLLADPTGTAVRSELAPYLVIGVSDPRSFNQTTIAPNFGPDRVDEWSFGIERQIVPDAVFQAEYVGNHAWDLFQSINANPYVADIYAQFPNDVPPGITPCPASSAVAPSAVGRANCDEGIVRKRTNTGYSNYEGLQLSLRTSNLFNQLTMLAAYTYSKTLDNTSAILSTGGAGNTLSFSQDPLNYTTGEYGLSAQDIPNDFALSFAEALPVFRGQQGVIGHILGGWNLAATYIWASGQPYSPTQVAFGTFTGAVGGTDFAFNNAFIGTYDTLRPFVANTSAPVSHVGAYAGDACSYFGLGCDLAPNTLISFNDLNTTGTVTTVTTSQVHFIANGGEAQTVMGTPFGNAARNSLRDAPTNTANFELYKNIKFWERATLQWHMSMLNAFNHPNFSSVDPFIEDAGLQQLDTGFGIPALTDGGNRSILFGLKMLF